MTYGSSLIFIPDISGFSAFVHQTDLTHSKHIISELLEIIINADLIDMKVAEIEGDAIFFYKQNYLPDPVKIHEQVRKMFIGFHSHLKFYESHRICHCGACTEASKLSLKFIIHLGSFDFIKISSIEKPHGEDIILAHRLLKNNIESREYMLFTDNLLQSFPEDYPLMMKDSQELSDGKITYESIGEVEYKYILLDFLHAGISQFPVTIFPEKDIHPVSYEGYIDVSKEEVYEIASNLSYRLKINKDASQMDFENERVNRNGLVHECVIKNVNYRIQTVTNDFGENKLVYGEFIENIFIIRKSYSYMIFEDQGQGTKLRYEAHVDMNPKYRFLFSIFKTIIRRRQRLLFQQLKTYCETEHLNQINS